MISQKLLSIIRDAGKQILELYDSQTPHTTQYKDDDSPLTKADILSNKILTRYIEKTYPSHAILSEENTDSPLRLHTEYVWIIDPLDGTKEFIKKNGEFTINVALTRHGEPILGIIYAPAQDLMFTAQKGNGACCNRRPIHVSEKTEHLILAKSRSHANERLKRLPITETITCGSSLKGCLVAEGKADCYVRLGSINEWDICAMHCILTEAGGTIRTLQGTPIRYNQKTTLIKGFIATNTACDAMIHTAVSDIFRK